MKKHLLIVDDDAVSRLAVTACVAEDPALQVSACDTAAQAWKRLVANQKVDLLLLDWNMPEMSGYDLVRRVRATPRFQDVRILMLTCENSPEHVGLALAAGADEYLMKPFTREMLREKLALLQLP